MHNSFDDDEHLLKILPGVRLLGGSSLSSPPQIKSMIPSVQGIYTFIVRRWARVRKKWQAGNCSPHFAFGPSVITIGVVDIFCVLWCGASDLCRLA